MLSTLGKETQSHFDFSKGLPECLRSNLKSKLGQPEQTHSNSNTSLVDFNIAMLNNRESAPASATNVNQKSGKGDHKAFLHDFISENDAVSPAMMAFPTSSVEEDKNDGEENVTNPYSSTLDLELPNRDNFGTFKAG